MTGLPAGAGRKLRHFMILTLLAGLFVLALREQVVRAPGGHGLNAISGWFDNHPAWREQALVTASAGEALGRTDDAGDLTRQAQLQLSRRPLSATPLLVLGAQKAVAGDNRGAGLLYAAAASREPRNAAAHFLLADHLLRNGEAKQGIEELLAATRLRPGMQEQTLAAIAAYLKTAGVSEQTRSLFEQQPDLLNSVLELLSGDLGNFSLVHSFLSARSEKEPSPPWLRTLILNLADNGRVDEAKALWLTTNDTHPSSLIFNPGFAPRKELAPFNWQLLSGNGGLAAITARGGLSLVYFGRENVTFARQLLTLPTGRYQIRTEGKVAGAAGVLSWTMRCIGTDDVRQFSTNAEGQVGADFDVPAGCRAQWLELGASVPETERKFDGQISNIDIVRTGP